MSEDNQPQSPSASFDSKEEQETSGQLAKKILNSLRKSHAPSEDTLSWLKNVTEDVPVSFREGNLYTGESQPFTMSYIIDKLFDDFQRYAYEFNLDADEDSLIQRCERQLPNAPNDKAYGYLATKTWAIVVQGEQSVIRAFLIPMGFIKEFYTRRGNFTPFMEMYEATENGHVVWKVEDCAIHTDELAIIDKKLFARLVRVVRGQASELEPFRLNLGAREKTLAEKPAQDEKDAAPSDADVEERILPSAGKVDSSRSSASLKLLGSISEVDEVELPSESLFLVKPKTVVEMLKDSHTATLLAVAATVRSIDEDLIMFSHAAIKALRSGDTQGVARIMKRCQNLRQLREKAARLAEEWNETVKKETT